MTITTLSPIGGLQSSQNISSASNKLQAVISSIASGSDATNVSEASQLQSQTSALKQASINLAQAASLAQVANGGIEEIQGALSQLQSLAQQAKSPALNATDLAALNLQFTETLNTINQIASGTSFNGQSLLNGNLSGNGALSLDNLLGADSTGNDSLSIGNLSSNSLLPGVSTLTSGNADQALNAITNAANQVAATDASVGSFQNTLGFASASVDSAIINQQAAIATLSDTDLTSASTQDAKDQVQRDASVALAAQGNKLSSALLTLVG